MGLILPYRNLLSFPAGLQPGFDPTHPALDGGQCRISVVPNGTSFINLLTGAKGALSGAPISSTFGIPGPGVNFTTNSAVNFANQSTNNDTFATVGAIITWTSAPATGQTWFDSSGVNTSGFTMMVQSTTNMRITFPGGALTLNPQPTTAIVINTPYFVAMSYFGDGIGNYTSNCLITNLLNGTQSFATQTTLSAGPLAPNGTYVIGNSAGSFTRIAGSISALMFSSNYLSIPQLVSWGYNPWSFWYPGRPQNFVGVTAAPFTWLSMDQRDHLPVSYGQRQMIAHD